MLSLCACGEIKYPAQALSSSRVRVVSCRDVQEQNKGAYFNISCHQLPLNSLVNQLAGLYRSLDAPNVLNTGQPAPPSTSIGKGVSCGEPGSVGPIIFKNKNLRLAACANTCLGCCTPLGAICLTSLHGDHEIGIACCWFILI